MSARSFKVPKALVRRMHGTQPGAFILADHLAFALIASSVGQPETAAWALRRVTDPVRRRIGEAKTRQRAERQRVLRLASPQTEPSGYEQRTLLVAEQAIAAARAGKGNLEEAVKEKVKALQAIEQRQELRWSARRLSELTELERLRGGDLVVDEVYVDVPILDEKGAPIWKRGRKKTRQERRLRPRLTNRDGLETLSRNHLDAEGKPRLDRAGLPMKPTIDRIQLASGLRYRVLYEAADPEKGLTPPNPDRSGAQHGDPFGARAVTAAHERSARRAAVAKIEAAVLANAGPLALNVLREVAGKGTTISALSSSGAERDKSTKAFVRALDAVSWWFGLD